MQKYQTKKTENNTKDRAHTPTILQGYQQSGPFSLIALQNGFGFGPMSIISLGVYGQLQLIIDLTANKLFSINGNLLVYCQISFSDGVASAYRIITKDVGDPLPMVTYKPDKFPSPKTVTAMNIRLCRTEYYRRGWQFVYGQEGAIEIFDAAGDNGRIIVRELFQSVQIIQTCFGFVSTSAVSSFPILLGNYTTATS